jgi:superfamily II DNA/RNA helicase
MRFDIWWVYISKDNLTRQIAEMLSDGWQIVSCTPCRHLWFFTQYFAVFVRPL